MIIDKPWEILVDIICEDTMWMWMPKCKLKKKSGQNYKQYFKTWILVLCLTIFLKEIKVNSYALYT